MTKQDRWTFFHGWQAVLTRDFFWTFLRNPFTGVKILLGMTVISLVGLACLLFIPKKIRDARGI